MDIFKKLWRGDLPLYVTFWLFGMIIGTILSVLVTNYALEPVTGTGTATIIIWLGIAILYTGFMCVSLWRSADKYKGAAIWSICARFYSAILFLSFISFIVDIFNV
ncbi:MAG: hypothetical protein MI749_04515 [Desulfovibrionales bacterium]|nr:hypothetical protein [Desulfovibrionales bacterium]